MSTLTFRGIHGLVLMQDGPREVTLTEAQCNGLLDIWEGTEAAFTYNALVAACQDAGFIPRVTSFPTETGMHRRRAA